MDRNHITIATITWARDKNEEEVLRESLHHLAALQLPVYVTDGGSGSSFLSYLRSFPHFTLLPQGAKGLWPQVKSSLTAAYNSGSPFIFYTEPDKGDFFRTGLPLLLAQTAANERCGIVLASRSPLAFASFPAFQQTTETTINQCCAEVMEKALDYTYGPFLVNRQVVPLLQAMQQDTGWGWRPYAFNLAYRLGYNIESFAGDFFCPETQRHDDAAERIYRMRQLSQNIEGLLLSCTAPLH